MSPQMVTRNQLSENGGEPHIIHRLSSSKTSPTIREYFSEQEVVANQTIKIGIDEARQKMDWLVRRVPVFSKLIQHFEQDERAISKLLQDAWINQHDFRHQQTVAGYAMALAEAFGVPEEEIEAVGLGACFHDMGYTPLNKPAIQATKEDFKMHAANGAKEFEALKRHPDLDIREYFRRMDPQAFRAAYLGIYYHNGGSQEYGKHKSRLPLSSKLVRAADKAVDNRWDRVAEAHLNPELKQRDKHYQFRTVSASIFDIALRINREFKGLDIIHDVDRSLVRGMVDENEVQNFQGDFGKVLAKQMFDYTDVMQDALGTPATNEESHLSMNAIFMFENGEIGQTVFSLRDKAVRIMKKQ